MFWKVVMENESETEVINLSDYCFEWYVNGIPTREGLVDDLEQTIEDLKEVGFHVVE